MKEGKEKYTFPFPSAMDRPRKPRLCCRTLKRTRSHCKHQQWAVTALLSFSNPHQLQSADRAGYKTPLAPLKPHQLTNACSSTNGKKLSNYQKFQLPLKWLATAYEQTSTSGAHVTRQAAHPTPQPAVMHQSAPQTQHHVP